jgi:hypothetical protein
VSWFYVGRTNYQPNGIDIRIGHWVLTFNVWLHREA